MRRATQLHNANTHEYNPGQLYQNYRPQHASYGPSASVPYQSNRSSSDGNHLPPPPPRTTPPIMPSDSDTNSTVSRLSYGARRSTSAGPGPTPTGGPSMPRATRTLSNVEQQHLRQDAGSGSSLPGPPALPPPPPSSRSRSAGGHDISTGDYGAVRQRPPRLQLRNSNLTPIPATPASMVSGASARAMPFPLRIDTGMMNGQGKAPAVSVVQPQESELQNPPAGSSNLARRSAVRGPAARSSGQMQRSRSKSISGRSEANELIEPPSTTMSNNPWASALEQARSPQAETLPESAVLPNLATTAMRNNDGTRQSHTPPATPSSHPLRVIGGIYNVGQQAKVLPTPPLSQKPLLSANSVNNSQLLNCAFEQVDDFVAQAMQRHADFLQQEQEANTDLDRLLLFTRFMQQESLIRKERYTTALTSPSFDIAAARDMLFDGSIVRRASAQDESGSHGQSPLNKPEGGWWKDDYRPNLSPIASMDYDEMSSRGRAASRWWESATGSHSDGPGHGVHRSKRESKYMSLSKKLLQDMETAEMEPLYEETPWLHGEQYANEKAQPDNFGYYDDGVIHPDLAEYRTTVRMLSDLTDARSRQSRHQKNVEAMRQERRNRVLEMKRTFRANIQAQIEDGTLSYAEAAEAEKAVKADEHNLQREGLQSEFDTLQDVMINPLHDQFNERIEHLSSSLHSLQKELVANAAHQHPDQPVQEGDDVPELHEQLTQLKWLFEAREILHQELFDLLSQRNDAYKAIVALPYHQTNNIDKIRDTEAFFEKDAATRHATFCAEALKRHESFLSFVEDNAQRGIALQSSAFWDIHPGLVDLLQKIPIDISQLDIHIPDQELHENPTYQDHPQQYLYTLLRHAEKSSYQFIEGQINLYCLVHEVKTSSLAAHYKASKAQQKMAGDQSIDLADTRLEDEGELTDELKNHAAMVEEQWQDALGKYFGAVQARVKQQLQDRGVWEEFQSEDS
ncbi:hypothetical protein LTR51_005823 [Lithohypha guttulata]|nr:hypothetical protein LTR51_005823 [Lithohypha guttulata]